MKVSHVTITNRTSKPGLRRDLITVHPRLSNIVLLLFFVCLCVSPARTACLSVHDYDARIRGGREKESGGDTEL